MAPGNIPAWKTIAGFVLFAPMILRRNAFVVTAGTSGFERDLGSVQNAIPTCLLHSEIAAYFQEGIDSQKPQFLI
jgi:hypothetical protein